MRTWFTTRSEEAGPGCRCDPSFDGDRLVVDAADCPGGGRLAARADCRRTVIEALTDRDADAVVTRVDGRERAYLDGAAALLVVAGRFADRVAFHDERLASRALTDPLAAAAEATGRAGPVSDAAAESGLAVCARRFDGHDEALRPYVGPSVSHARVRTEPPSDGRLRDARSLSTGATARRYERPGDELDVYHLEPAESALDDDATATLERARELLASGGVRGERAARRAVRRAAEDDEPVERLGAVLEKHTRDLGVFVDLFADERVSDAFADSPIGEVPLHVRVDGALARTNVRLTERGARGLASGFRLRSGRAFSRADPTLDATATVGDRRVRVAATAAPVSDGLAFAFRAHDRRAWTLAQLVANGTVPADAAALLSVAVERGAATLFAGARGAGKTTALSAVLWELPVSTRTLVIEDTPELPVQALRDADRDVQALRASDDDGPEIGPGEVLRTALRLGEGALVVGEVRGEEAAVLYEAMRVGANASAVLGTVHGAGGERVRERVVSDLGVPESSFATTDLVVTMESFGTGDDRRRRVARIEEVVDGDEGVRFAPLFALEDGSLRSTGRIERGNSAALASLLASDERYTDLYETVRRRARTFRPPEGGPDEPALAGREGGDRC